MIYQIRDQQHYTKCEKGTKARHSYRSFATFQPLSQSEAMSFEILNMTDFISTTETAATYDIGYYIPYGADEGDGVNLTMGNVGSIVIALLLGYYFIYSIIIDCKSERKNRKPLRLAISIFSINVTVSIIQIIQTWLFYNGSSGVDITLMIGAILNSVVAALLYGFMMMRLYQTFKETMYEVKRGFLYCHGINIIYVAIGGLFFPYVLLQDDLANIEKVVFIIIILMPFTVGLGLLIYSFNHKLFQLVLLQRQTLLNSNEEQDLNARQLKMLKTIRKHTILGFFIVLAQLILAFTGVLIYGISGAQSNQKTILYWMITDIAIIMETTSLFIGFSDNNQKYLCLCKYCDKWCTDICINIASKEMNATDQENVQFTVAMTDTKPDKEKIADSDKTHDVKGDDSEQI